METDVNSKVAFKCNGNFRLDGGDRQGYVERLQETISTPYGDFDIKSDGLIVWTRIMEVHVYTCDKPFKGPIRHQPDFTFQAVSAKIRPGRQALVIVIPNHGSIGISWDINNPKWYR